MYFVYLHIMVFGTCYKRISPQKHIQKNKSTTIVLFTKCLRNEQETTQTGDTGQEQVNQWSSCCRSNPYLLSPTPNTQTCNLSSSSNIQPSPERSLMRAGVASIQSSTIHHCTIIREQSRTHNYCTVSLHRTLPCNAHMQMHAVLPPPPPLYELSKTPSTLSLANNTVI